ncbi:DUF3993 domain-containing protein [Bacillus fonticola]|uniref:DUF3993 domain-containing protein n=1 Tax=Bacillus fonticola TaxID=2728853 RepID=UPI0014737C0B|nr:DUF3993 domain-containing protein [Bacillus fonticola]
MMSKIRQSVVGWLCIVLLITTFSFANRVNASEGDVDHAALTKRLDEIRDVQILLTEKPREMDEIFSILGDVLAPDVRKTFIEEHVRYVEGQYMTFGTDFGYGYVPFFTENAKVISVDGGSTVYVGETFSGDFYAGSPLYAVELSQSVTGEYVLSDYFPGKTGEEWVQEQGTGEALQEREIEAATDRKAKPEPEPEPETEPEPKPNQNQNPDSRETTTSSIWGNIQERWSDWFSTTFSAFRVLSWFV